MSNPKLIIGAAKAYRKLESLLSSLLGGRFPAHPDFHLLINGCRNHYAPAVRSALNRLVFESPEQYPLRLRQSLLELSKSLRSRNISQAVKRAYFALGYARQIGFAPRHRRLEKGYPAIPPPPLPLPRLA